MDYVEISRKISYKRNEMYTQKIKGMANLRWNLGNCLQNYTCLMSYDFMSCKLWTIMLNSLNLKENLKGLYQNCYPIWHSRFPCGKPVAKQTKFQRKLNRRRNSRNSWIVACYGLLPEKQSHQENLTS